MAMRAWPRDHSHSYATKSNHMTNTRTNRSSSDQPAAHKPRPLMDLAISIVIPSLILMKLSGEDRLGVDGALLLALAFPLGWGLF